MSARNAVATTALVAEGESQRTKWGQRRREIDQTAAEGRVDAHRAEVGRRCQENVDSVLCGEVGEALEQQSDATGDIRSGERGAARRRKPAADGGTDDGDSGGDEEEVLRGPGQIAERGEGVVLIDAPTAMI